MANPDDEKTVINVKGVSISAWEDAKRSAAKVGESMGFWLSQAARDRANLLAGDRVILPGNPEPVKGNPLEPGQVAALMQGFAATVAATGVQPKVALVKQAYAAMESLLPGAPEPRQVLLERAGNGRFLKGNPAVKKLIFDGNL